MLGVKDHWDHTYGDVSVLSPGTAGSIPPVPMLGTAPTLPSLSFPVKRFQTWGINNHQHHH